MANYVSVETRLVQTIQYVTPTTGATITVNPSGFVKLLIDPAGTLATLTVNLPASPSDGDNVSLSSSQIVTGFTMGGGTIVGALTTLVVATFAAYMFNAASGKWWRVG